LTSEHGREPTSERLAGRLAWSTWMAEAKLWWVSRPNWRFLRVGTARGSSRQKSAVWEGGRTTEKQDEAVVDCTCLTYCTIRVYLYAAAAVRCRNGDDNRSTPSVPPLPASFPCHRCNLFLCSSTVPRASSPHTASAPALRAGAEASHLAV
jgi:hypothetical protein